MFAMDATATTRTIATTTKTRALTRKKVPRKRSRVEVGWTQMMRMRRPEN
ncbi:unnamed protein product [Amoebophrya sp. A120]|nr:unnamed protein product [Amoebophrya sp. A120]|eukprot:GSA120T00014117001.1